MIGLPLFTRIDQSALAGLIRDSTWLFAAIESLHLLGLTLLGGAVLLVDLRLLGLGLRQHSLANVEREAQPWLVAGLAVMLPTGFLMFASEAVKCYENGAFWVKMTSLLLAIVFTFTIRRRVAAARFRHSFRSVGQTGRDCLPDAVVRRGLGRPMDWVFVGVQHQASPVEKTSGIVFANDTRRLFHQSAIESRNSRRSGAFVTGRGEK